MAHLSLIVLYLAWEHNDSFESVYRFFELVHLKNRLNDSLNESLPSI